jgi:hypothetical protein
MTAQNQPNCLAHEKTCSDSDFVVVCPFMVC